MIQIYHNNRCSKSRCGLKILEDAGVDFEVVNYLNDVPSEVELRRILNLLGIPPLALVRQNEAIWKSDYKGKTLSDDAIITAMLEHPKLIERPIIIKDGKAVIGRPPETILDIL